MSDDDWNFNYPKIARNSGFKFHQFTDGNIDWRQIGGIEVEKIIQNQNIEKLDNIIDHLAEVPLGPLLSSNILESGIAKYFILSQLAIQYLIFCKRFLDETVTSMRTTLKDLQSENNQYKKSEQEHANDILHLHKELQKIRNISEIVFPCSMCTKNFVNNEMLNIHISRKHSNDIQQSNISGSEKRTDKENDKNLISTIKLELEIKHLKERLSDAEKVIRDQTIEISKEIEEIKKSPRNIQLLPPTEKIGKTVAVQNDIVSVKSIGIQSNLVEDKEKDDVDFTEKNNILEIFKQINEKINKIEKVRDDDLRNREENLMKFENKLENVTQSLEAKQQHNLEILNKFTNKWSSQTSLNQELNLDELKDFLGNAIEKMQSENKKQFIEMAEKFDETYLEKLNELKTKIENINETEVTPKDSSLHLKAIINENKDMVKKLINTRDITHNISGGKSDKQPITKKRPIVKVIAPSTSRQVIPQTESSESESSQSYESSESEASNTISYSNSDEDDIKTNVIHKEITNSKNTIEKYKLPLKESKTLVKESTKFSKPDKTKKNQEIVPPIKLKHPTIHTHKLVKQMQINRFKKIGLSPSTKFIPTSSMPQISAELLNIRRAKKKLFPNFSSTRNQIKVLVDKVIRSKNTKLDSNRSQNTSVQSKTSKKKSQLIISPQLHKNIYNSNENILENKDSISSRTTSENEEREHSDATDSASKQITKDAFKLKLERILSSPIHKLRKEPINEISETKIPVPTPRKKVMFDFTTKDVNIDDDSSLLSDAVVRKDPNS